MKATETKLLAFLKKSEQFKIPSYQRIYSWTEKECRQLWDDIIRTGSNKEIAAHFMGSIMYIGENIHVSGWQSLHVIDGQQRLTTVTLILEALARAVGDKEPVDGFKAEQVRAYYLLNQHEKGERHFKLLLTQTDKDSLRALLSQPPKRDVPSRHIKENFEFFKKKIDEGSIDALCRGLEKLTIVDITLSRDKDNPQRIFESMNSMGRELSQADLIRNFILMGLEPDDQRRLYEDYWRKIEEAFGQKAYEIDFDRFMRHYLTFRTGEIPNVRAIYEAFKKHARSRTPGEESSMKALVADIHTFANYYCAMALDKENDNDLKMAFKDIRALKVNVAFPFLLELYDKYKNHSLSKEDFLRVVRLIESYVFRRAICAMPTNSLNKVFATFGREMRKRKEPYIQSVETYFMYLPSYRRFPRDEEFKYALSGRNLYNFSRSSYWLRRLENHGRKESVPEIGKYTIEHIMPQNENLSPEWQNALGAEWKVVQEKWLHTLGNLTLTRYNAEYSDKPFLKKRDIPGGFKDSPLWLNKGLGKLDNWNKDTIQDRARRLAVRAAQVWMAPELSEKTLASIRDTGRSSSSYILQSHPQLAAGSSMRSVFDAFREEVLALDPCVREEILKTYIAFKAETNFVDVVPQKNRLMLFLNLRFPELQDPKCRARDVTNIGHYGNGDAEVTLSEKDELPYVIGLVRQAFEKQIGDEVDEE